MKTKLAVLGWLVFAAVMQADAPQGTVNTPHARIIKTVEAELPHVPLYVISDYKPLDGRVAPRIMRMVHANCELFVAEMRDGNISITSGKGCK